MSSIVVSTKAPCGCRIDIDDSGEVHLHPCRDRCPNVPTLIAELRRQIPDVAVRDLRQEPHQCN